MPQQLLYEKKKIALPNGSGHWDYRLSIVRFEPKKEEIFLSYSRSTKDNFHFQHGPGINRDGKGPPWMWCYEDPSEVTTDADEQRIGTWPHDEENRKQVLKLVTRRRNQVQDRLTKAEGQSKYIVEGERKKWQRFLDITQSTPSHEDWFKSKYPEYLIIGEQGCGDLTMNSWYVAYIKSRLTDNQPEFIHLRGELLETRRYTCVVKWATADANIMDLRFQPYLRGNSRVMADDKPVADSIEFAVYGKPVIRNGSLLDMRATCHQYSDIRHLFLLANLNPSKQGFFYGKKQDGPIFFGEAQLLGDRNLRRAALSGPIELDRLHSGLGASIDDVRSALTGLEYTEKPEPAGLLNEGEWRFTPEDNKLVDIFLKRSQYSCSMIGIDRHGGILCLAFNARAWDRVGDTIESATLKLVNAAKEAGHPVRDALIFDEGADVFQRVRFQDEHPLSDTVPMLPGRRQIRAMFIFGKTVK